MPHVKIARSVVILCVALISMRCNNTMHSTPTERENVVVGAVPETPATTSVADALSPPAVPSVPRTLVQRVEVPRLPRVYVDRQGQEMILHRKLCRERTAKMLRLPLAIARSQGGRFHAACEHMKDPPDYREEIVVHPEWIAYEAALAGYNQLLLREGSSDQTTTTATPMTVVEYPASSQSSSGSSGQVHVKGYYRKDGTYVRPHTRSRPKK